MQYYTTLCLYQTILYYTYYTVLYPYDNIMQYGKKILQNPFGFNFRLLWK